MFPSSGYFKGIACPYFLSGLCERPFCHFRHSNQSKAEFEKSKAENGPTYSTPGVSGYGGSNYVGISQQSPCVSNYSSTSSTVSMHQTNRCETSNSEKSNNVDDGGDKDTPLEDNLPIPFFSSSSPNLPETVVEEDSTIVKELPRISGLPSKSHKNLPSYVPTPKASSTVTETHAEPICAPSYTPTPKSDPVKKVGRFMEYDPEKNYSVFDKAKTSDEEDGDGDEAFSDDDENEESENRNDKKDVLDNKVASIEDDLTDSDEDVSYDVDEDKTDVVTKEKDVSTFADLLTPSSFFTEMKKPSSVTVTKERIAENVSCSSSKALSSLIHSEPSSSNSKLKHNPPKPPPGVVDNSGDTSLERSNSLSSSSLSSVDKKTSSSSRSQKSSSSLSSSLSLNENHSDRKSIYSKSDKSSSRSSSSSVSKPSSSVSKSSSSGSKHHTSEKEHTSSSSKKHTSGKEHTSSLSKKHKSEKEQLSSSSSRHTQSKNQHKSSSSKHLQSEYECSPSSSNYVRESTISDSKDIKSEKNVSSSSSNLEKHRNKDSTSQNKSLKRSSSSSPCVHPEKTKKQSPSSHKNSDKESSSVSSSSKHTSASSSSSKGVKDGASPSPLSIKSSSGSHTSKHSSSIRNNVDYKNPPDSKHGSSSEKENKNHNNASSSKSSSCSKSLSLSSSSKSTKHLDKSHKSSSHHKSSSETKIKLDGKFDITLSVRHKIRSEQRESETTRQKSSTLKCESIPSKSSRSMSQDSCTSDKGKTTRGLAKERRFSSKEKEDKHDLKEQKNQLSFPTDHQSNFDNDSDIEIIEPDPPPVYNVSDSDNESDNIVNHESDKEVSEKELSNDDTGFLNGDDDFDMSDEEDTFDECLRIFQESERQIAEQVKHCPDKGKLQSKGTRPEETAEDIIASVGRKRMAHANSNSISRPHKALVSTRPRLSPAQVMHNRIVEMQKKALLRAARREGRMADLPPTFSDSQSLPASQKGITVNGGGLPSPKVSATASSKVSINGSDSRVSPSVVPPAAAEARSKQRVAHTPSTSLFSGQKTLSKKLTVPYSSKTSSSSSHSSLMQQSSVTPEKKSNGGFSTKKPGELSMSPNTFYTKNKTSPSTVTIAGTASKTEKRKAHEPTLSNLQRPLIPAEFGGKVPTNIRQRYLNCFIDEHLKFRSEEEAYIKGQEDEKAVYEKATNKNIYLRVAVIAVKRIRTEASESLPSTSKRPCLDSGVSSGSGAGHHQTQSHAATLGGKMAVRHSYTLNRSRLGTGSIPDKIEGKEFYERLSKYIMSESKMRDNGFPRPSEGGGSKVLFFKEETSDILLKDNERVCRRCGKRYNVASDGTPINNGICMYHYGGSFKKRVSGHIESRHSCCNERDGVKGCQVASFHVHEKNKQDNRSGYMKTMPEISSDKNYKVYALDCEMVYTKAGLELARVTVVGEECEVVYETLVLPDTEIIDYNTRFSGITAADMKGVKTTIRGVQAVLLSMISDKTILMGHSLESDLIALKLIHSTVVDTSIVFPHRLGPPYKRALRNLMMDHLKKIIQSDDGGHDSKEDAASCMELMKMKVKEDAKRDFRRN